MRRRVSCIPTRQFQEKVKRDAALISEGAQVVVEINESEVIRVWQNSNPNVGVIGIIGPGKTPRGYHFPEVVLEEIGIGPSRPYHKGRIPMHLQEAGKPRAITYRYQGFVLSNQQYQAVAPVVFEIIQQLADKRVGGWESGTSFCLPGVKYRYNRSDEKMYRFGGLFPALRGARFSVALESFFARDVFWAEQMLNSSVIK